MQRQFFGSCGRTLNDATHTRLSRNESVDGDMTDRGRPDLENLASLLRQHNAIGEEIARLIGRPAERGHVGEYIASRIFGITLANSATTAGTDGTFAEGALAGHTVNVKWYGKQERVLDLDPEGRTDFYLALTGEMRPAVSSRGTSRPWVIAAVYLFGARRLHEDLRARGVGIGVASSVRQELWTAAEIYPEPRNTVLALSRSSATCLPCSNKSNLDASRF